MTPEEYKYFESKHKQLIEDTCAEFRRINDPNFIEMGATYHRINGHGNLITPLYFEWGVDENDHQMTWKNAFETERDKGTTYGYNNIDAPLLLIKVSAGNGRYPPNRFRTKFHYIDGIKVRIWCFTSRDHQTNKLSFEMRFHLGLTYHCIRGNSWNKNEKGCYMYLTELDNRTQFCKRGLTMREVKQLVFGDPRYNVSKLNLNNLLLTLQNEVV